MHAAAAVSLLSRATKLTLPRSAQLAAHLHSNLGPFLTLLANATAVDDGMALRQSLLATARTLLFSPDNLRRGLARESYRMSDATSTRLSTGLHNNSEDDAARVDAELFAHLARVAGDDTRTELYACDALPDLFHEYNAAMLAHADALFPMPASASSTSAASASGAQRSAQELYATNKRRALAAAWVDELVQFTTERSTTTSAAAAAAAALSLARSLDIVDQLSLYSPDPNTGWRSTLTMIARTYARHATETTPALTDAALDVLSATARMSPEALEPHLSAVLGALARAERTSPAISTFVRTLAAHHARMLTLPAFFDAIASALSTEQPAAVSSDSTLLSATTWREAALGRLVREMLPDSAGAMWRALSARLVQAQPPARDGVVASPSRSSPKRRKLEQQSSSSTSESPARALAALLASVTWSLPTPLPVESMRELIMQLVDATRAEALYLRYAIIERLVIDGHEVAKDCLLDMSACERLVSATERDEAPLALLASLSLVQHVSLDPTDATRLLDAALRPLSDKASTTWSGRLFALDKSDELPAAIWSLLAQRWLPTVVHLASRAQVNLLARVIVSSLDDSDVNAPATARLLARADFYELAPLRPRLQEALVKACTLPGLADPAASVASKKLKADRKDVLRASRLIAKTSSILPRQYLERQARKQIRDSALALDVWLTRNDANAPAADVQVELRRAYLRLHSRQHFESAHLDAIMLLVSRLSEDDMPLIKVTLRLYRAVVASLCSSLAHDATGFLAERLDDRRSALRKGRVAQAVLFTTLDVLADRLGPQLKYVHAAAGPPPGLLTSACRRDGLFKDKLAGLPLDTSLDKLADEPFIAVQTLSAALKLSRLGLLTSAKLDTACRQLAAHVAGAPTKGNEENAAAVLALFAERLAVDASMQSAEEYLALHLMLQARQPGPCFPPAVTVDDADCLCAGSRFDESLESALEHTTPELLAPLLQTLSGSISQTTGQTQADLLALSSSMTRLAREGACIDACPCSHSHSRNGNAADCARVCAPHMSAMLRLLAALDLSHADDVAVASYLESTCADKAYLLSRTDFASAVTLCVRLVKRSRRVFTRVVATVDHLIQAHKDYAAQVFAHLVQLLVALLSCLRVRRVRKDESDELGAAEAQLLSRLLISLTTKTLLHKRRRRRDDDDDAAAKATSKIVSLIGPLSKHAPFLLVSYLHLAVDSSAPIPAATRAELQPGLREVLGAMGKHEKEALMKGLLRDGDEPEREILRSLWKSWERERYKGS